MEQVVRRIYLQFGGIFMDPHDIQRRQCAAIAAISKAGNSKYGKLF